MAESEGLLTEIGRCGAKIPDVSLQNSPRIRIMVMNTKQRYALGAVAAVMLLSLGGCSGMSGQDKNTAIGAGAGAVGGALLTDGSVIGTLGGAAVGGIIGHEVSDPD
jgi:osmotically inducible lipoprotein OsmB